MNSAVLPARVMPREPAAGLVHVGTYLRRVALRPVEVFENALDWEHLPWLHAQDFSAIECIDSGPWGWRARVVRQPAVAGSFDLELLLDADRGLWVSRTIGDYARTGEIWSRARPVPAGPDAGPDAALATDLKIEFHVPADQARDAERAFARRRELYARLWDQDEAFSWTRARRLEQRARRLAEARDRSGRLLLGTDPELRARLPLDVEFAGRRWWIREVDGEPVVHAAECPHMLGPLEGPHDREGCVRCPWHGYRFDVRTGAGCDGVVQRLPTPPALRCVDGTWVLGSA